MFWPIFSMNRLVIQPSLHRSFVNNAGSLGLLLLFLAPPILAQVVNDGATATLNHITNTISGGVTVGTNGPFTLLILTTGTLLTNSGNGPIGLNAGANYNT